MPKPIHSPVKPISHKAKTFKQFIEDIGPCIPLKWLPWYGDCARNTFWRVLDDGRIEYHAWQAPDGTICKVVTIAQAHQFHASAINRRRQRAVRRRWAAVRAANCRKPAGN